MILGEAPVSKLAYFLLFFHAPSPAPKTILPDEAMAAAGPPDSLAAFDWTEPSSQRLVSSD